MARKPARLTPFVLRQVRSYRTLLKEAGIPFTSLLVFGSRAKGTARPDSDIDLAVISPSFGRNYFKEGIKLSLLRNRELLDIEPHPFHPDDLNDRWSTFSNEVKKYGIPV